jgi:hypothetical protein
MAITKASSKTESWTIRIPNELAEAVRASFPPDTGNTQIVTKAIRHLLGIDPSILSNNVSNDSLTELKLELEQVRSRLSAIEQNINFNKTPIITTGESLPSGIDQEWMNLGMMANRLNVKPKSISDAVSKRGEPLGNDIIKFDMSGMVIHKQGKGLNALYQLQ